MKKEEFLAGLPFKIKDTNELQSVYSFVDAMGIKCIQEYTILSPSEPRYHCTVFSMDRVGITVKGAILGKGITFNIGFDEMHRVGDAFGQPNKYVLNEY